MRRLLFSAFPLVLGAAFWFGVSVWPDLASKDFLRTIAGLFGVAWAAFSFALPKLSDLTALEGMTESERERLRENVAQARKKIWNVGGLSLLCAMTLLLLSVVSGPETAQFVAGFGGVAAGYGCVLLFRAKAWHDEIHAFVTDVHKHRLDAKSREDVLKRLANSSGG